MLEFSSKSNSNVVEKGLLSTATQTSSNAYSGCCRGIGYFTRSFSFDLSSWCAAKILRDHNSKRAGSFDAPEFFTALKLHIVTFSCLPAHLFASPQEVVGGREAAHWVMTERLPVRQFRRRSYWLSFRRHTSQFAQGKCWSRDFARLMQRIAGETEANSLFMRERAPPTMQHICGLWVENSQLYYSWWGATQRSQIAWLLFTPPHSLCSWASAWPPPPNHAAHFLHVWSFVSITF